MNIGKIVQVIGNVVDINPTISDEEDNLIVEAAQHLGDNVVRCVGMDTTDGLVRGMPCKDTGAPIQMPVGKPSLGRVLNVVGRPVDGLGPVEAEPAGTCLHRAGYLGKCVGDRS
jgi:F-type H+-transporting ATPase subunit beta